MTRAPFVATLLLITCAQATPPTPDTFDPPATAEPIREGHPLSFWIARLDRTIARSSAVQRRAAAVIAEISADGGDAVVAIPGLVALLRDRSLIDGAAEALHTIGDPGLRALHRALGDSHPRQASGAASALIRFDEAGRSLLFAVLAGGEPTQQIAAAHGLRHLPREAAEIAVASVAAVAHRDDDAEVRAAATWTLSFLSRTMTPRAAERVTAPATTQVIAALAVVAADPDAKVRQTAAGALHWVGSAGIPLLLELLVDDAVAVRQQTAKALKEIPLRSDDAERTLPALLDALADPDATTRGRIAHAIGRMGERARAAIERALDDDDPDRRAAATIALSQLPLRSGLDSLIATALDPEPAVAASALATLGSTASRSERQRIGADESRSPPSDETDQAIDQAIDALLAGLAAGDVAVRVSATRALSSLANRYHHARTMRARDAEPAWAARVVEPLAQRLDDDDWNVRFHALRALGFIGGASRAAAARMAERIADPHMNVRGAAAAAVGWLGEDGVGAVPTLEALLDHPNEDVVDGATRALGKVGSAAAPAAPALDRALRSGRDGATARSLAAIEGDAAIQTFVELLDRESVAQRLDGLHGLAALGHRGRAATAAVIDALRSTDPGVRTEAATTLERIRAEPERAVPALIAALHDGEASVRATAARALRSFRADAAAAVPDLMVMLADDDHATRGHAISVLEAIGPAASPAAELLVGMLREYEAERSAIIAALTAVGDDAVPTIAVALDDPDSYVREGAAMALRGRGPPARATIPRLSALLGDDRAYVRRAAFQTLGSYGDAAAGAVPAMVELLDTAGVQWGCTTDPYVEALTRIGTGAAPALARAFDVPNEDHQLRAALILYRLAYRDPTAATLLMRGRWSEFERIRSYAMSFLGNLGERGRAAEAMLRDALDDPEPAMCDSARAALDRMNSDRRR